MPTMAATITTKPNPSSSALRFLSTNVRSSWYVGLSSLSKVRVPLPSSMPLSPGLPFSMLSGVISVLLELLGEDDASGAVTEVLASDIGDAEDATGRAATGPTLLPPLPLTEAAERCDRLPSTDASVADEGGAAAAAAATLCLSGLVLAEFRALFIRFCPLVGDAVEASLTSATTVVVLCLVSGDPPPKSVDPVCLIDPGLLLCWSKLAASVMVAMASWMTAGVLGVVAVVGFGAEEAAACGDRDLFDVCNVLAESSPESLPVGF